MAMNLQPGPRFVPGMNTGMSPGMPPGFADALAKKYAILQQQANADSARAAAEALLNRRQASVVVPEAMSRVGLNNANAYKTRQEGDVVKPLADADIRRNDAWIRASDEGMRNQRVTTDANAGLVRSQTTTNDLNNAYIPLEKRQALETGEIKKQYLPGTLQSGINANNAAANANNAQGRNYDADTRNRDTIIRPPGDQSMMAPLPSMPAPFQPSSALAALLSSPRAEAMKPTPTRVSASPARAPAMPPMSAPIQINLASADPAATPSTVPGMAPVIRREVTPSFLDEQGGSSFLKPMRTSFLSRSPFSSPSLQLKRGTARVPGKGSGDKVPAMLEPGEAILNKHAAGMIGRDKIAKANAKGNQMRTKENLSKLAQALQMMGMV